MVRSEPWVKDSNLPNFLKKFILSMILMYCPQILDSVPLIGGKKVQPDEIKYLVSLQSNDEHYCGGSIIDSWHVLSAAHCVIDDNNKFNKKLKIIAGTNDLSDRDQDFVEIQVEKVYVPSSYDDSEWDESIPVGDVAVLRLKQSLNLKQNQHLKKVRLPRADEYQEFASYESAIVTIAGFGWNKIKVKMHRNNTEFEVGSSSNRLRSARAIVISNFDCQQHYDHVIHESDLCARVIEHRDDTPQGVCRGDSGGPLIFGSNTIIGIVSGISIGCNENREPGIYTRVSSHMEFIRNAVRDVTDNMRVKTYK
ncbi:hypothetical protein QAD02_010287 [Eretmocerus hayati]|uniref:Uncharacterized protein n=1 Tax=Eretmocerus hayati TaxID=131215 RepID=A0ACC2NC56_9HYME|nr:hypothetical protein QAD02_010287 [Eretmocerus hayati]